MGQVKEVTFRGVEMRFDSEALHIIGASGVEISGCFINRTKDSTQMLCVHDGDSQDCPSDSMAMIRANLEVLKCLPTY